MHLGLTAVRLCRSQCSILCNTNSNGPGLPPPLSVQEEPVNLCDGSNGAVLGWLASEHITGFSTLHAAEADDPKMALQESQRPARLVSNGMAPVRGVRPLETRGQRSDPQGVLQSGPEERHGRQLMGGDRSGRIGSSISARRTRRKPSTREIKAATKEPRLKDDAMRTMVGKEKTGNSNSYMPKN